MRWVLVFATALASVARKKQPPPESHAEPAPSAAEGTFELDGKSFYAVDIAQRCGATKLLSCRLASESQAQVQYASRICVGLVK